MTVRYITEADDPAAISGIYEKSWKSAYKGIIPQEWLDSIPEGKWARHLGRTDMKHLILEEGGVPLGTASFCASRWEEFRGFGEIVSIYLLPEHTGRGLGRLLMQECLDGLRSEGFTRAMLWVLEDNLRARRFYEKLGFTPTGAFIDDEIGGKPLRETAYTFAL